MPDLQYIYTVLEYMYVSMPAQCSHQHVHNVDYDLFSDNYKYEELQCTLKTPY